MTDFRARGTIMGLAGLTAVFGMGTGGAPPVSSPEVGRGAVRPPRPSVVPRAGHAGKQVSCVAVAVSSDRSRAPTGVGVVDEILADRSRRRSAGCRRRRIGVVKRSAVRTGRLRRSPVVHSRPIDLVVFQEPSSINRLETSS